MLSSTSAGEASIAPDQCRLWSFTPSLVAKYRDSDERRGMGAREDVSSVRGVGGASLWPPKTRLPDISQNTEFLCRSKWMAQDARLDSMFEKKEF